MSNVFQVGQLVRVSATFRDSAGVLTDPSTIVCSFTNPRGDLSTKTFALAEVVKDSTGVYHFDIDVNLAGKWRYGFKSTGLQAGNSSAFTAESTVFP